MKILERASQVLQEESKAVLDLIETLDHRFETAVELILSSKGRVVCTGMGKSGHIARKVAATLASTGTPALFLHPGEGVHGDLGMVTADDVVLAFSNSGETSEVISLLPSLRRIGAKLISVVGNPSSTLGKNSDVVLIVCVDKEACPLGLAPTSSTTAALALGDALAVCLLDQHQFTPENFAVFHPGGSLGRKLLLTVENIMHGGENNPIIYKGSTVQDALFVMTHKGLGATNVVDEEGHLIGLVTDGDIRRGLDSGSNFLVWPVEDMMTKTPRTITKDKLAAEALHMMEKHQPRPITVLPVVSEDGKSLGLVHITDLLRRGII
jgi:sugar isomerase, kpsF/gutQ family